MRKKLLGLGVVLFWYALALLSLAMFEDDLKDQFPWIKDLLQFPAGEINPLFWMTIWMTVVIYIGSTLHKNASLYDPYWSVLPILFALLGPVMHIFSKTGMREHLMMAVIFIWGVRLTANWVYTWPGLHHQDWRYTMLKEKTGKLYPVVNFTGIHLFPTLIVLLAYVPAIEVFAGERPPLGLLDYFAFALGLFAVSIQTIADIQMHAFRKKQRGKILQKGLWRWSRHPNYLGEILFWTSIFLFGNSSGLPFFPYVFCPVAMLLMFVFISIPMMEKRQAQKEGWNDYKLKTGMLLPKITRK